MKQIDYIILEREHKEELANDVAKRMSESWECQGGVQFVGSYGFGETKRYIQAMVKYDQ